MGEVLMISLSTEPVSNDAMRLAILLDELAAAPGGLGAEQAIA